MNHVTGLEIASELKTLTPGLRTTRLTPLRGLRRLLLRLTPKDYPKWSIKFTFTEERDTPNLPPLPTDSWTTQNSCHLAFWCFLDPVLLIGTYLCAQYILILYEGELMCKNGYLSPAVGVLALRWTSTDWFYEIWAIIGWHVFQKRILYHWTLHADHALLWHH